MKILENFGWFVAESTQKLELSDSEQEAFLKGVKDALNNTGGPEDKQAAAMEVQQYLQSRFNGIMEKENEAFFAELKANPNIKQSPTGLYYEIIEEGDATRAGPEDSVKVHYKGTLVDGTEFDSSYKRGEPATFPVGGVVKGFGEGVQLVGAGGKVKLYIPGNLGYGPNPPRGSQIPPNGTLIFDVEMVEVNPDS
ncbi:FKBP-type peptidyl-prolyl cis-trans isomerase [Cerasicoccus maritimus]|uniref:FKBP-type peptidyl-prolyl cis-trans isomerase n=1 Tax=Cerasicoccus maritimus TaxID=490089 RepID=UPI002852732B|nr:FKBP-type peptidyl-prolyl cis-trans isomerase [Cerasicoccus maritimus]